MFLPSHPRIPFIGPDSVLATMLLVGRIVLYTDTTYDIIELSTAVIVHMRNAGNAQTFFQLVIKSGE